MISNKVSDAIRFPILLVRQSMFSRVSKFRLTMEKRSFEGFDETIIILMT
jgi:hypothetical protein